MINSSNCKLQITNHKKFPSTNEQIFRKKYDLEERTLEFSKRIIALCKKLTKDVINTSIVEQLIRASTSVGANYREASENISKKDFLHKMKITRKECKESSYWFRTFKRSKPIFL